MTIHLIINVKTKLVVWFFLLVACLFSSNVFAEDGVFPQQLEQNNISRQGVAESESIEKKSFSFLSEKRKNVSTDTDALGVSLGLFFILLLIFSMAWFMKKMGYSNLTGQGQLKILATLNLGQKEKIALIQVGKQQLLVGMTATHINTLHVLDESIDEAEINSSNKISHAGKHPFADKLSVFLSNKK